MAATILSTSDDFLAEANLFDRVVYSIGLRAYDPKARDPHKLLVRFF